MVNSSDCSPAFEKLLLVESTRELRSMIRMHSSVFNSPRQYRSPTITRQPIHRIRAATYPPSSSIDSNPFFFLSFSGMDHVLEPESDCSSTTSNPEADKIERNSLYLTFNAPQVDEYVGAVFTPTSSSLGIIPVPLVPYLELFHRGIFLTHPPLPTIPDPRFSGTLFHASYTSVEPSDPSLPAEWVLDQRVVKDVSTSHSLVLLYRIGTLDSTHSSVEEKFQAIRRVLENVPLGRANRERKVGPLKEGEGNQVLDGYDCVIWTRDALAALAEAGLVDLNGNSVDTIMTKSRALAGPEDAKTMVGVDFGGFRVVN
ncbi:hypothetical protein EG329_012636 [Mollisiaceae sp. DMI_Dod_QoI]|nr:hypothetical protein EG329_012636 [Helotiales sp. DMI_Dod_QoI]